MSNISDYPTPTSPERELDPVIIVPSEDDTETNSHGINVEHSEDQPQRERAHLPTTSEDSGPEQHGSSSNQPHNEPSIFPTSPPALQDRVDSHPSTWFQNMFEQLRDQHNDLRTLLEANTVFKAEEAKLQELLTQVRDIVGPRVSKWIDEDVAASMEAGKLVRRDLFVLDAEFNCSNDDDDASKSKRGDSEGHIGEASRTNGHRKGKGKAKDNDDGPSQDPSDQDRPSENATTSRSLTRSNQRKRSLDSQSDDSDETTSRQKRPKLPSAASIRSPSHIIPPSVPEKSRSPLKRSRDEVEDNADGSEDEVEKSITMLRSFSSILEDSGPVSKKARREGNHDTAHITAESSGSSGLNSHRPQTRFTSDNHTGPSTSSRPSTSHLFPPSAFPRVRPPPPPKRPQERKAKPLQRDTMRVRANPDTGAFEVFDYESTPEYLERLQREHHSISLQPKVWDTKADLQAMTEPDGPRFKFDRDAWREFEDHTLIS